MLTYIIILMLMFTNINIEKKELKKTPVRVEQEETIGIIC